MARVLFLETDLRNEKLGIMYLSAALKNNGHETMLCWIEREEIDAVVRNFQPDFFAFSLTTGTHRFCLDMAVDLKQKYEKPVICGGPHATFFPESITAEAADHVVMGQGERAVVDIVSGKATGRILRYALSDLDALPFPDRELFYRYPEFSANPMKNIITCRDCPYSCSYCYNHSWKTMFRQEPHFLQRRSVENVIEEAMQVKAAYPLEKLLFIDDNFLFDKQWVKSFCGEYKEKIGLPFLCSFSLNLLDEELLEELISAGLFMVNFAIESADPHVQKTILNRGHVNNEQIIKAVSLLKRYGVRARMQNMIGLPIPNSYADAINTLRFNKDNRVEDSWVSIFQPYPKTALAEYTLKEGYSDCAEGGVAGSFFDRTCLAIENPDMINRLQKWWYFIVRYRISDKDTEELLHIELDEHVSEKLHQLRFEYSRKFLYGISGEHTLEHDWTEIVSRYGDHRSFPRFASLIREYRLSTALTGILMQLDAGQCLSTGLHS